MSRTRVRLAPPRIGAAEVRLAAEAAASGALAEWVEGFLRGSGHNVPSADGLLQAPRWYHGPVVVPLAALTRICGPEPGMRRPEHRDHWRTRIAAMVQSIGAG